MILRQQTLLLSYPLYTGLVALPPRWRNQSRQGRTPIVDRALRRRRLPRYGLVDPTLFKEPTRTTFVHVTLPSVPSTLRHANFGRVVVRVYKFPTSYI